MQIKKNQLLFRKLTFKTLFSYSHPDSEEDPEMDEEIQEAYEEFLKTCKS